jgi:hypothetical protein
MLKRFNIAQYLNSTNIDENDKKLLRRFSVIPPFLKNYVKQQSKSKTSTTEISILNKEEFFNVINHPLKIDEYIKLTQAALT